MDHNSHENLLAAAFLMLFLTLARVGQELGVDLFQVRTKNGASPAAGLLRQYTDHLTATP